MYHNLIAFSGEPAQDVQFNVGLREKLLGVEGSHFYDLYADMVESVEMKFPLLRPRSPWALAPLGPLQQHLKGGFENAGLTCAKTPASAPEPAPGQGPPAFGAAELPRYLNDLFTLVDRNLGHAAPSELSSTEPARGVLGLRDLPWPRNWLPHYGGPADGYLLKNRPG